MWKAAIQPPLPLAGGGELGGGGGGGGTVDVLTDGPGAGVEVAETELLDVLLGCCTLTLVKGACTATDV